MYILGGKLKTDKKVIVVKVEQGIRSFRFGGTARCLTIAENVTLILWWRYFSQQVTNGVMPSLPRHPSIRPRWTRGGISPQRSVSVRSRACTYRGPFGAVTTQVSEVAP